MAPDLLILFKTGNLDHMKETRKATMPVLLTAPLKSLGRAASSTAIKSPSSSVIPTINYRKKTNEILRF
ncbi:hypothetical protein KUTeg_011203 [Tegillarca granosa]|uniref:Uncharacterized protein n=1 Tax=Tegillarca granosa TaxID=220873 RepID=A0ABQ9F4W4_TEGGR|nr:hypothetical protein KUTeg_011203 [Tegillarca granosa]